MNKSFKVLGNVITVKTDSKGNFEIYINGELSSSCGHGLDQSEVVSNIAKNMVINAYLA